jgi:hypothetical protein
MRNEHREHECLQKNEEPQSVEESKEIYEKDRQITHAKLSKFVWMCEKIEPVEPFVIKLEKCGHTHNVNWLRRSIVFDISMKHRYVIHCKYKKWLTYLPAALVKSLLKGTKWLTFYRSLAYIQNNGQSKKKHWWLQCKELILAHSDGYTRCQKWNQDAFCLKGLLRKFFPDFSKVIDMDDSLEYKNHPQKDLVKLLMEDLQKCSWCGRFKIINRGADKKLTWRWM